MEENKTPPLKPLRTYESDVADLLARRNTSSITMALAESRKKQGIDSLADKEPEKTTPSHVGIKILIIFLSLLFAGGGIFGAYYLYSISPLAPVTKIVDPTKKNSSLIPEDSQIVVEVNENDPYDIQNKIKNELTKNQNSGTIKEIVLVKSVFNDKKEKQFIRVTSQTVAATLGIGLPDILYRSLTPNWFLGIYANETGQRSLFVIASNNFFQNAFAGMLQWESIMADDLRNYLMPNDDSGISNSLAPSTGAIIASTTTTTKTIGTTSLFVKQPEKIPVTKFSVIRGQFVDKIIKNKDIREFRSSTGQILFLYTFIDNERLLFTTDESLVTDIMGRLEKQAFVR